MAQQQPLLLSQLHAVTAGPAAPVWQIEMPYGPLPDDRPTSGLVARAAGSSCTGDQTGSLAMFAWAQSQSQLFAK